MSATAISQSPSERVSFRRLAWAGPLAIVAAALANVVYYFLHTSAIGPFRFPAAPGGEIPATAVALFTVVGTLGGLIVFAILARFSKRPIFWYQIIAAVFLVISFASPLTGGVTDTATIIGLEITHVIAAVVSVLVMTRLSQEA